MKKIFKGEIDDILELEKILHADLFLNEVKVKRHRLKQTKIKKTNTTYEKFVWL